MSRPSKLDQLVQQRERQRGQLRALEAIANAVCRTEANAEEQRKIRDRIDALSAAIVALGGAA